MHDEISSRCLGREPPHLDSLLSQRAYTKERLRKTCTLSRSSSKSNLRKRVHEPRVDGGQDELQRGLAGGAGAGAGAGAHVPTRGGRGRRGDTVGDELLGLWGVEHEVEADAVLSHCVPQFRLLRRTATAQRRQQSVHLVKVQHVFTKIERNVHTALTLLDLPTGERSVQLNQGEGRGGGGARPPPAASLVSEKSIGRKCGTKSRS